MSDGGRNHNVDIFRAASLLIVMIYHSWVLSGATEINNRVIKYFVSLGGEIGVTGFFILSGYGIYMSLDGKKEKISYRDFMARRLKRILPQYYINLMVVILMTGGVAYIAKEHFMNVASHALLLHNFSIKFSGTINGVLWTMPVIFQFYIVAPVLYKLIKKHPVVIMALSVAVTVFFKALVFKYIGSHSPYSERYGEYAFFAGRQFVTAMDNFVLGMGAACVAKKSEKKKNFGVLLVGVAALIAALYFVCSYGIKNGIHTNNRSGYIWHSLVALVLAGIVALVSWMPSAKTFVGKAFIWLSKYEYGIYLWHLILMLNILGGSPWIHGWLANGKHLRTGCVLIIISIIVGVLFTVMTDGLTDKLFGNMAKKGKKGNLKNE